MNTKTSCTTDGTSIW